MITSGIAGSFLTRAMKSLLSLNTVRLGKPMFWVISRVITSRLNGSSSTYKKDGSFVLVVSAAGVVGAPGAVAGGSAVVGADGASASFVSGLIVTALLPTSFGGAGAAVGAGGTSANVVTGLSGDASFGEAAGGSAALGVSCFESPA